MTANAVILHVFNAECHKKGLLGVHPYSQEQSEQYVRNFFNMGYLPASETELAASLDGKFEAYEFTGIQWVRNYINLNRALKLYGRTLKTPNRVLQITDAKLVELLTALNA